MSKLNKGPKRLFEFLRRKQAGDLISTAELLQAAHWKPKSLVTHKGKNKISPFLLEVSGGMYKVLHDGSKLSESYFQEVFTQVKPEVVVPSSGDRLTGRRGTYVLEVYLGAGAVGHVWKAHLESSGHPVALKIMMPRADLLDPLVLPNVKERFRREAQNGLKLNHPNVLHHLDIGEWRNTPFLVMEKAERSLSADLLGGPMTDHDASKVIAQCAEGLAYLHDQRCIHRDVKPDNILVVDGRYVLGDLGIVSWNDLNPAFTGAGTITKSSIQLGSWYYMAPEQFADPHRAVYGSDIYALGISWLEMLTCSKPHPHTVGAGKFADPSGNKDVCRMVRSMLSYAPAERPTAIGLSDALRMFRLA